MVGWDGAPVACGMRRRETVDRTIAYEFTCAYISTHARFVEVHVLNMLSQGGMLVFIMCIRCRTR